MHHSKISSTEKPPCNPTSDITNPILTTEQVESMINLNIEEPTELIMTNDNIEKPSNDITNNKDPSTPAENQFHCEIC